MILTKTLSSLPYLLLALFALDSAHAQKEQKVTRQGWRNMQKQNYLKAKKEHPNLPEFLAYSFCRGRFKLRAGIVTDPAVYNNLDYGSYAKSTNYDPLSSLTASITIEHGGYGRDSSSEKTTETVSASASEVKAYFVDCINLGINEKTFITVSDLKPTITQGGKSYELKSIQIMQEHAEDLGYDNFLKQMTVDDSSTAFAASGKHKRQRFAFGGGSELTVSAADKNFMIDLFYEPAGATTVTSDSKVVPTKKEAVVMKARIEYPFPACEWTFEEAKAKGLKNLLDALASNEANKLTCELWITGSASNTAVNQTCNDKEGIKIDDDAKANKKLAKHRANAIYEFLHGKFGNNHVYTRGIVSPTFIKDANSAEAAKEQYLEVDLKNCKQET